MVRVDLERCGVGFPGVADGLERCSPSERLEVLGEVIGSDERQDVGAQRLGGFVVERLGGGILDGLAHALGLAVGLGVVGQGAPVLDAVLVAHAVEHVARRASGTPDMLSHLAEAFLVNATPLSVSTVWIWQGKAATAPRIKAAPVAISAVGWNSTWTNLDTRSMARTMCVLPSADLNWALSMWT